MTTENMLRRKLRHGRQKTERTLERLGAGITAYIAWPIWTKARCLFVLSTGRTGTKTLAQLLSLSEETAAFHEPRPQLLKERQSARWEVKENERKYRHIFIRSRGARLLRAEWRNRIYAETSARLTFFAPVLVDLLPNAKFLFIHRDPTGVVQSGMKRGWYVDHPADYARVRPVEGEPFFDRWEKMSPFEKICWYWNVYNKFALRFCQQIDSSRVLKIQASELFDGKAVPQIFSFLDLPQPAQEEIGRIMEKKLNAQREGAFPEPERWTPSMFKTLRKIAGGTMERLDYSVGKYAGT